MEPHLSLCSPGWDVGCGVLSPQALGELLEIPAQGSALWHSRSRWVRLWGALVWSPGSVRGVTPTPHLSSLAELLGSSASAPVKLG